MFPPFNTEIAYHYCLVLQNHLEEGFLSLKQVTRLSEERAGQGVMIGSLVCQDSDGCRIVLCANSGISRQLVLTENPQSEWTENGIKFIIVPPVVSALDVDKALKKNDKEIHEITDNLQFTMDNGESESLKKRRDFLCRESLEAVHKLYNFKTITNCKLSISNCQFPTGTGDCCEPKLLHFAFSNNLKPVSMAEIFYDGGLGDFSRRMEGERYVSDVNSLTFSSKNLPKMQTPCDERCGFLLPKMLGLEILYVDKFIVVVNKPSGLLSVPGRGEEKQDCVVNRVKTLYPALCRISQPSVHRLDMETSGILVLAFTEEAHKNLSLQFEKGEVYKEYTALLDGVLEKQGKGESAPKRGEKRGMMKLKFRLDVENRPHQIYDEVFGKEAVTNWCNEGLVWYTSPSGEKRKSTKIRFIPYTGRTHQLRLASSDSHGFGLPIIGDSLYGKCEEGERLMLHAERISFIHPINGHFMTFEKRSPF
ncbi:MAG: RluA family pseudouridine synthase [Treponema sp.]|nr:RluA family pseudouridine synthase [Treponema sp.]